MWLSVKEVAVELGVKQGTVYRLVANGRIEYLEVGLTKRIHADVLKEYIKAHTHVPTQFPGSDNELA